MICAFTVAAQDMPPSESIADRIIHSDSVMKIPRDSLKKGITGNKNWWNLVKNGKLDIKNPQVKLPKFLDFCRKIYNWGDQTFNSYDPEYVEGTGKKWKALVKSDNWLDSYGLVFTKDLPVLMSSDIYYNAGLTVSFMAVSLSYMLDLSNIIGNEPALHKKLEFNFSCARFVAEAYYYENKGGTYIRRFGNFNRKHLIKKSFPGLNFTSFGGDIYYFFNNRKYSQGAIYNFSKYQKRNAGSFIAGATISNHDIRIDFNSLPQELEPYYTLTDRNFRFHYNDYCILLGYGHNFVAHNHLMFNITALPSIGYKHTLSDCVGGSKNDIFSLNLKGRAGMTYNINDLFLGVHAKIDTHWFLNKNFNFFNTIVNMSVIAGVRF